MKIKLSNSLKNRYRVDTLLFAGILEMTIILAFLMLKNQISDLQDFIMLFTTMFLTFIGVFFGLLPSLIASIIAIFVYGTFKTVNLLINNVEILTYDYVWFFIMPLVSYTAGRVGDVILTLLDEHEILKDLSFDVVDRDEITKFKNLKTFNEEATQEMELSRRHKHTMSFMLVKIKYLKEFKNIHGQTNYEELIKQVSIKIIDLLRISDKRYMVEEGEFVLMLFNTPYEGADVIKNRLKAKLEEVSIEDNIHYKLEYEIAITEYDKEELDPIKILKRLEKECEYDV
ncbi:MAG: diguanylate cyclase [Peptostreptococcaceae bacterium]|nr:diguanylate cyclase [Peptostreptococcaceae bacterium]